MKCPHCNQEHPDDYKFCPTTGKEIELLLACPNPKCSKYGERIIPKDSKCCPYCGTKIEGPLSEFAINLKKAEEGDAEAQFFVGYSYYSGENGVNKDINKAVYWLKKSADQGNPTGQIVLGVCYQNGAGVEKDMEKAFSLYRDAASTGDMNGLYMLGMYIFYQEDRDLGKAFYWLEQAASKGHINAKDFLKNVISYEGMKFYCDTYFLQAEVFKLETIEDTALIIPSEVPYNGKILSVNCIGKDAFANFNGITSITIPESVKRIRAYAFRNCRSLETIVIPENVTYIGEYAFDDCVNLSSMIIKNPDIKTGHGAIPITCKVNYK